MNTKRDEGKGGKAPNPAVPACQALININAVL